MCVCVNACKPSSSLRMMLSQLPMIGFLSNAGFRMSTMLIVMYHISRTSKLVTTVCVCVCVCVCVNACQVRVYEWCSHSFPIQCSLPHVNHAWRLCPTEIQDDWQHHVHICRDVYNREKSSVQMLLSIDRLQNDRHSTCSQHLDLAYIQFGCFTLLWGIITRKGTEGSLSWILNPES